MTDSLRSLIDEMLLDRWERDVRADIEGSGSGELRG